MPKLHIEQPNRRNALGAEGERRAADHLKGRGYRIVARNVRAGGVEMDVIARRGPLLVFVEVKTRRSRSFGSPEEAVDARKRARLIRGATAWLHENGRGVRRARFDVIVCECDENEQHWRLRHLEAAFDANG
jgi:putative endonuclease